MAKRRRPQPRNRKGQYTKAGSFTVVFVVVLAVFAFIQGWIQVS